MIEKHIRITTRLLIQLQQLKISVACVLFELGIGNYFGYWYG